MSKENCLNIKGHCKLFHGDCLEVMKRIPDDYIDMVLCDPPYGINYQSCRVDKINRKKKILNDKKPFIEFIPELKRIIKSNSCVMVFTRWDVQQQFIDCMNENNMKVKNVLIWDKGNHGMGDYKTSYGSKYESIIFSSEKQFRFNGKRPEDIIRYNKVSPKQLIHPNEKPIGLLEILVTQCTKNKDIVLDMFMGSGSTGIACMKTDRKFIGIELDDYYYKLACGRIKQQIEYGE